MSQSYLIILYIPILAYNYSKHYLYFITICSYNTPFSKQTKRHLLGHTQISIVYLFSARNIISKTPRLCYSIAPTYIYNVYISTTMTSTNLAGYGPGNRSLFSRDESMEM